MPGRIPQSFINDLIERVDIVEVIDSRVSLKRTGKNLQALCPFHEEKTPSFSVNPENGQESSSPVPISRREDTVIQR